MEELVQESIKKTIALDIDGTLFYTSKNPLPDSIEMGFESDKRYVKQRPHLNLLFEYLDFNKEFFNVIIYSAGTRSYIEQLVNFIEKKHLISEIYDREFCDVLTDDDGKLIRIKNYKKINKNLHNLYLVDDKNSHFDNYDVIGYKCKKFKGEEDDNEILNIIDFLEMLKII